MYFYTVLKVSSPISVLSGSRKGYVPCFSLCVLLVEAIFDVLWLVDVSLQSLPPYSLGLVSVSLYDHLIRTPVIGVKVHSYPERPHFKRKSQMSKAKCHLLALIECHSSFIVIKIIE